MCNDYHYCGLRMIDAQIFALAQKMTWVKCLVDKKYSSMWKTIELTFLENFHTDSDILWKSYAPERILKSLNNTQLAESLRTWYSFREEASLVYFDHKFSDIGGCQLLCGLINYYVQSLSNSSTMTPGMPKIFVQFLIY